MPSTACCRVAGILNYTQVTESKCGWPVGTHRTAKPGPQLGKAEMGRHALDVSLKCLEYYEAKFGSKYPLPKLDLLAIPDFAAGAMENWGAVTCVKPGAMQYPRSTLVAP